ncbi:MAG: OmpA family protein [Candidatus Latescibacteria bacterium]|nr:OmpA family protein [Candidatus Latescibacterota bacterium]
MKGRCCSSALVWAGICLLLGGCTHRGPRVPEEPRQRVAVEQRARTLAQATAQPQPSSQPDTLVLESIYFDYRKDQLRPDQQKVLLRHAERLKARPEVRLTLTGHCDDRGTPEFNKVLGAKRAERVMEFLVEQGIAPERLKTLSLGEEQPVDRGRSEAARARNRRVEFAISPLP